MDFRGKKSIFGGLNLLLLIIVEYSIIDFLLSSGHKIIVEHIILLRICVSARPERQKSAKKKLSSIVMIGIIVWLPLVFLTSHVL